MRKKLLIGCLAVALMSSLCACGDKKTDSTATSVETTTVQASEISASELLEGLKGHENETLDSKVTVNVSMSTEMPNEEGENQSYQATIDVDMDIKANVKSSYTKGTMNMTFGEEVEDSNVEMYTVTEDDGSVTVYQSEDGTNWIKDTQEKGSELIDVDNLMNSFTTDTIVDATVSESEVDYILEGKFDYASLTNDLLTELGLGVDTETMNALVQMPIKMIFDKNTKNLKSMEVSLNSSTEIMGMTLDTFKISIICNSYSTDEITVPDEIIKSAVEKANDDNDLVMLDDDGNEIIPDETTEMLMDDEYTTEESIEVEDTEETVEDTEEIEENTTETK